ncbi:hypothetical protein J6590_106903 [Homalodisca vitripennis]|nr:hypothetical protein J6590_106903 [Homalodisca vitripennis]
MSDTCAEVDEKEISERLVDPSVLQQASTSKLANKGLNRNALLPSKLSNMEELEP